MIQCLCLFALVVTQGERERARGFVSYLQLLLAIGECTVPSPYRKGWARTRFSLERAGLAGLAGWTVSR